ncbi:hypothetical protein ACOMHN_038356 [Nucella lapillus]
MRNVIAFFMWAGFKMGPMECDDNGLGHTPSSPLDSREAQSLTSPANHSTPRRSPSIIPAVAVQGILDIFNAARAYVVGTLQRGAPTADDSEHSSFSCDVCLQRSRSPSPLPGQSGTLMGSPRRWGATSPGEDSVVSRDLGDLSQMKFDHNSPTFRRVAGRSSAHSSVSPFEKPESEQGSVTGFVTEQGIEPISEKAYSEKLKAHVTKSVSCGGKVRAKSNQASKKKSMCSGLCMGFLLVLVVIHMGCAILDYYLIQQQHKTFANVDMQLLKDNMASKLYGQHIAAGMVSKNLERFFAKLQWKIRTEDEYTCIIPPLVLSFHGWEGVGKTLLTNLIPHAFPFKNVKHIFPYHFHAILYRNEAHDKILSSVRDYTINFFIVDNMETASPRVLEGIHSAIAQLRDENPCRSPVVMVFVSNTFEQGINRRVFQAMMDGQRREDLSVGNFSSLFEAGGNDSLWYQALRSDITATVPFLPLAKEHVVQCIHHDLAARQLPANSSLVNKALENLQFDRLPTGQEFSPLGCKRVWDNVGLAAIDSDGTGWPVFEQHDE